MWQSRVDEVAFRRLRHTSDDDADEDAVMQRMYSRAVCLVRAIVLVVDEDGCRSVVVVVSCCCRDDDVDEWMEKKKA